MMIIGMTHVKSGCLVTQGTHQPPAVKHCQISAYGIVNLFESLGSGVGLIFLELTPCSNPPKKSTVIPLSQNIDKACSRSKINAYAMQKTTPTYFFISDPKNTISYYPSLLTKKGLPTSHVKQICT